MNLKAQQVTFILLTAIILISCQSSQPITISVSGPSMGQSVTVEQRIKFTNHFGERFKAKFGECGIRNLGADAKVLEIQWVNVSRPFAEQMAGNNEIIASMREMGFKRLILTDGNTAKWDIDLKN